MDFTLGILILVLVFEKDIKAYLRAKTAYYKKGES